MWQPAKIAASPPKLSREAHLFRKLFLLELGSLRDPLTGGGTGRRGRMSGPFLKIKLPQLRSNSGTVSTRGRAGALWGAVPLYGMCSSRIPSAPF